MWVLRETYRSIHKVLQKFTSLLVIVECGLLACWTGFVGDTWILITGWLAREMVLVKEKKSRNGDKTQEAEYSIFFRIKDDIL